MISFNYETDFQLEDESKTTKWISSVIETENFIQGDINYVFCDDNYLHKINLQYLNHDTLTDIISFDYSIGKNLQGDVFISVDRVRENAKKYEVSFQEELDRVLVHGILHYIGYKDKSDDDAKVMRDKEDYYLKRRI